MNAQEMAQKVRECKALQGVEVDVIERRNKVVVYGFHQTADCNAARAAAEALGFSCGPNSGSWQGEMAKLSGKIPVEVLEALNSR